MKKPEKYYQDSYVTIGFAEESPFIFIRYEGLAKSHEHFIKVHQIYFELLKKLKIEGYFPSELVGLSDMREAKPISQEDRLWLNDYFFPKIYALGYRKSAVLVPKGTLAQIIYEDIKNDFETYKTMKVRHFEDLEEAKLWLSMQNIQVFA